MFFRKRPQKLVLYCDGGIGEHRRAAGLGVVIRDVENEIIALVKRSMPAMTNNEAEYAALVLGLQSAWTYRPRTLQVFMDSDTVVGQMTGRMRIHSIALRQWHTRACHWTRRYKEITFTHIPRELNRLADALANEALVEAMDSEQ
jgi:ribonuclease HI